MAGVNKVILIGRLGADPEVRYLESGAVVTKLSIATSESFTNREGNKVENTEWHNVEMWEKLAKVAEQYLKKGDNVYIEGKIRSEQWQDKDGNNRRTIKIRANSMQILSRANNGGGASNATASSQTASDSTTEPSVDNSANEINDLPF